MTAPKKRLDLDAALAERDQDDEPLVVRFFDEDWELPGTMPAAVVLRIAAWQEDGLVDEDGQPIDDGELTTGQVLGLLRDMVPADILDEWIARGLTMERYAAAVEQIMASYSLISQADQLAGKAQPRKGANRATRRGSGRSSSGGRSSKPTSPASTASRTSSKS